MLFTFVKFLIFIFKFGRSYQNEEENEKETERLNERISLLGEPKRNKEESFQEFRNRVHNKWQQTIEHLDKEIAIETKRLDIQKQAQGDTYLK